MSRLYKVKSDTIIDNNGKHWGDAHQVQTKIDYIDGLGKTVQKVLVSGSPTYKDIISRIEYDNVYRLFKEYLPVMGTGSQGNYNGSSGGEFYNNDVNVGDKTANYFTEHLYDNSPLGRVTEQKAPGVVTGVKTEYRVNFSSVHGDIKWYKISTQDAFRDPQDFPEGEAKNYPEGSLSVVETKDENNKKVEQFSDRHGRVILKRIADQEYTYYVYNAKGLLRYVLQPQFQVGDDTPSTKLERFAFQYSYDGEGRVTSKKVPGQNLMLIEYYDNDMPKYLTDGNGKKFYYKYDGLNRQTEMGIIDEGEKPLLKTYYDNYDFVPFEDFDNEFELTDDEHFSYGSNNTNRRGLVTGTSARVLNDNGELHANDSWLQTVTYYDAKGRVIQVHRQLHGLGSDAREQESFKLDFLGNITMERSTQYTSSSTYRLEKSHTYDQQSRLLATSHKFYIIVNDAWVLKKDYTHTSTTYNEVGTPSAKKMHGNIQGIKHKYTPRGWLYTIENNGGKTFSINLRYNENGNIKKLSWQTQNSSGNLDPIEYDDSNRLKAASSSETPETNITYDKNGNIKTLTRGGAVDDILTYDYTDTGNQLKSISDTGDNSGVKNGTSTFSYDNNGNMTADGTRGATVAYNLLNLPRRVDMTSPSQTVQYVYDGGGRKLQMTSPGANTLYAGAFEYASGGTLLRIALEEGQMIRNDVGEYEVNYYLRDHLGNVRQVLNEDGDVLQETEYYPFGLEVDKSNPLQTIAVRNSINRYNFLGKETQAATGYIDLQARFYDPTMGRFFNIDPETDGQVDFSPYHYSFNNPIRFSDPDGRFPDCCGGIGDFFTGFGNALTENIAGASPIRASPGYVESYNNGRTFGHVVSAVGGAFFTAKGAVDVGASGTALVVSGGTAAPLAVPGVIVGVGEMAIGINTMNNAINNLKNDKGRVNADGTRNPDGAKGKPDHQEKVAELSEKARAENPGMQIINERKIRTEGSNRRPDVQVVDPKTNKTTRIYEAERRPNSQRNRKREEEYKRLGIPNETHKVGN